MNEQERALEAIKAISKLCLYAPDLMSEMTVDKLANAVEDASEALEEIAFLCDRILPEDHKC